MAVIESSIPALLRRRAERQPNARAFTFVDYDLDPAGSAESLTWSQVYQRAQVVAEELSLCGAIGDRAAILAPQGLDYIAAFLGALHAGFIAVPLSVPQAGSHDERVSSALRDSSPVAILTTSAVADDVTGYARGHDGHSAPRVVEVDSLDLDTANETDPVRYVRSRPAYLQYTSGSTRTPTGVVISHPNVIANLEQVMADYFADHGGVPPADTTLVSWLPFYHDMGLIFGICAPIQSGRRAVLLSPMAFLQQPARWIQTLASNSHSFSAAPNFAFELAVRRTTDGDMAGLDLGNVLGIISGSERIHAATLKRFGDRFGRFNFRDTVIRPSYGLAEATVYVATPEPGRPAKTVRFEIEKLSAGHAKRCENQAGGTELVSYGPSRACTVRIVDPDTGMENPAGTIGEIWVHGENVALGYWRKPHQTERTFAAQLVSAAPGTPEGPWLRTGDLGVISDGELFIMGRIKDLLIVDGRNHYPDDIEATIQEITGGRAAAISVPDDHTEQLVAIVELKQRGNSPKDAIRLLRNIKNEVTSAISQSHRLRVADVVLVPPGSIPITTSGKVRRSACIERYGLDDFARLDVPV
jgi:long chain fatty acid CoA FadD26